MKKRWLDIAVGTIMLAFVVFAVVMTTLTFKDIKKIDENPHNFEFPNR